MLLLPLFVLAAKTVDPRTLVDASLAALQRSATLADVRSIRLTGIQHEFILGNAERAEGPWRVQYIGFNELRDTRSGANRRTEKLISPTGAPSAERAFILVDSVSATRAGAREIAASRAAYEDLIDRIDASPERALMLARDSRATRVDGSVKHYGNVYDVVSFPWRNGRMKIEINRDTHLPDAIEIVRTYPDNFRWAPFGDVRMRADYVDWNIQSNGVYWPMQVKVSFNGQPLRDVSYASVAFDTLTPAADSFAVSDSARVQFARNSALNFSRFAFGARGQPTELVPNIVRVPDQWMMTMVKQPDGVVIFEAHISPRYVSDVIAEANRRWPGAPVKAFIMTSDPWGHLGGFSEVVRRGIPIYASAGSMPFLAALPHSPGKSGKFIPVSAKTTIGKGDNRIDLYPVGGPYAERMLMAYFPQHKMLYGADLVFMRRGLDGKPTGGFLETEAVDLRAAVVREKLDVESLFCVQNYGPFKWSAFIKSP